MSCRRNPAAGETSIFIYPPYRWKRIGALLTNFHLPRSTLIALVAAMVLGWGCCAAQQAPLTVSGWRMQDAARLRAAAGPALAWTTNFQPMGS